MKMRPREWVCAVAPGCHYKVGIQIHRNAAALREAVHSKKSYIEGDLAAVCTREDGRDDRVATLHFCQEDMPPEIVAHEVFHAVAEMIRMLRLNMDDDYAQEIAAHAVTHLVQQVGLALKRK